jgi:tetratricopeptide (TPR) repeat protein/serine/threonine protein kinase
MHFGERDAIVLNNQFIGRYRVIEELGRGGMGIVYHGEDPTLERPVAIKVLPPKKLSQKAALQRFLREARISARLDNPYIIKVYDIGEEEGIYHIVMEFVSGRTLREVVEARDSVEAVDQTLMVRYFWQVCQALDYAHEIKIIHRDIKPENIMVTGEDRIKVMDFGLAVLEDRHSLTDMGAVMGTFAYFSPEQARGEKADPRSDIYSLGIVLYEMLTNRLPFEATNPSEMIQKHLYVPAPSSRGINPAVHPILDEIILRTLKKHPGERYQAVRQILDDLDRYMAVKHISVQDLELPPAKEPLPSRDDLSLDRTQTFSAAMRDELLESAGDGVKAPAEEAGPDELPRHGAKVPPVFNPIVPFQQHAGPAPVASREWMQEAVEPSQWVRYQQLMSRLRNEEVITGERVEPSAPLAVTECVKCGYKNPGDKKYCQECGGLLAPSQFVVAREAAWHNDLGLKYLAQGKHKEGLLEFQQAIARDATHQEAHLNMGRALMFLGRNEEALQKFHHLSEQYPGDPRPHIFSAEIYRQENRREQALSAYRKALRLDPGNAETHYQMAFLFAQLGNYPAAIEEYRIVLGLNKEHAEAHRQLGILYYSQEYLDEAIAEFEWVVHLEPDNSQVYNLLGQLYAQKRKMHQAEKAFQTAVQLNPDDASTYANLGALYATQNKEELALRNYRQALSLDQGNLEARMHMAGIYLRHAQSTDAINILEEAAAYHPQNPHIHKQLGDLYLSQNQLDRALLHFEKTVVLDPESAEMHSRLGRIYFKKEYGQLSLQEYKKAVQLQPYRAEYHEDLAMAYYQQSDRAGAIEELKKASILDADNAEYRKALGIMLDESGRLEEAVNVFKDNVARNPRDSLAHGLLGRAYMKQGLTNVAILEFQKAVELNPSSTLMRIYLAQAFAQAGKLDLAIEGFKRLIESGGVHDSPESQKMMSKAYTDLGKVYLDRKDFQAAQEVLSSSLEMKPDDARAMHLMGVLHLQQGNVKKALEYLTEALSREPQNGDILADLGRLYEKKGDTALAIKAYRRALQFAPGRGEFYQLLSALLAREGRYGEAQEMLRSALILVPQQEDHLRWLLGGLCLEQKSFDTAVKEYRRAVGLNSQRWDYHYDLARAYEGMGRNKEAMLELQRAMELEPPGEYMVLLTDEMERIGRKL